MPLLLPAAVTECRPGRRRRAQSVPASSPKQPAAQDRPGRAEAGMQFLVADELDRHPLQLQAFRVADLRFERRHDFDGDRRVGPVADVEHRGEQDADVLRRDGGFFLCLAQGAVDCSLRPGAGLRPGVPRCRPDRSTGRGAGAGCPWRSRGRAGPPSRSAPRTVRGRPQPRRHRGRGDRGAGAVRRGARRLVLRRAAVWGSASSGSAGLDVGATGLSMPSVSHGHCPSLEKCDPAGLSNGLARRGARRVPSVSSGRFPVVVATGWPWELATSVFE